MFRVRTSVGTRLEGEMPARYCSNRFCWAYGKLGLPEITGSYRSFIQNTALIKVWRFCDGGLLGHKVWPSLALNLAALRVARRLHIL